MSLELDGCTVRGVRELYLVYRRSDGYYVVQVDAVVIEGVEDTLVLVSENSTDEEIARIVGERMKPECKAFVYSNSPNVVIEMLNDRGEVVGVLSMKAKWILAGDIGRAIKKKTILENIKYCYGEW